ncbi:hypothetical protein AGABI2DRAFT_134352 [Agaricus bisporus var. bisporus H97]|uniref:hypothetical protein n=1 Tax=Agaricus bisporus var. bisporus (strain H97 / ATCC MYA-4626 / FGSC 10389) TaxID=936046 RepID=UPI00029F5D60|nr:hypothetical protein AGABI2DRAFT_134352 [Agaricus bisporus var. bisporus H97]EKV50615.1 hypothetical protein AGABI2DRAFT_134352 [Agaricus bisporus var. bisporus H97]
MIGLHGLLVNGFLRHLKRQKERKRGEAKNEWGENGRDKESGGRIRDVEQAIRTGTI